MAQVQPVPTGTSLSERISKLMKRQDALLESIESFHGQIGAVCPYSGKTFENQDLQSGEKLVGNHRRLHNELISKGITRFRFVRAPPEYYDEDLEFRRKTLNAPAVEHLCKSIVMENTKIDGSNLEHTKYWLIIVQYSARLNNEKLRNFVINYHDGKLPRSKVNMRLVAEEKSVELSGYVKNSVTPIGMKTQLPIVISKSITELVPDEFWIGAGEVDLKVGMPVSDFLKAYPDMHIVEI
eukprot:jgi/Picsp_1/3725/NSC_06561-R1_protein